MNLARPYNSPPRKAGGVHFTSYPTAGTGRLDLGPREGSMGGASARTGIAGKKSLLQVKSASIGSREGGLQTGGRRARAPSRRPSAEGIFRSAASRPGSQGHGARTEAKGPGSPHRGAPTLADRRPRAWAERPLASNGHKTAKVVGRHSRDHAT